MDQIVLTIKDRSKLHFLLELLSRLEFIEFKTKRVASVKVKEKEKHDFFASAGLWENRNITIETLREKAWKRSH